MVTSKTKTSRALMHVYNNLKLHSIADFARILGVSQSSLHAWLTTKRAPSFESLDIIIAALAKENVFLDRDYFR